MSDDALWVTKRQLGLFTVLVFVAGFVIATILAVLWLKVPPAQEVQVEALRTEVAKEFVLTNIRIVDGDTLQADVALGFDVSLKGQIIRCADYDAWEAKRIRRTVEITEDELEKGKKAARALGLMMYKAIGTPVVTLTPIDRCRDSYGRCLGIVKVDGTPVMQKMVAGGHVRVNKPDEDE